MTKAHDILTRLRARSPGGFAIALHIQFTTPRYLFQAYDRDWIDTYSSEGMVMRDPTVRWAFANTGAIRWSALAAEDTFGVLTRAADFGLRYGGTFALDDGGSRSMASFARSDRELSDIDMAGLAADLRLLHLDTLGTMVMSPEMHDALRQLSIYLTHG